MKSKCILVAALLAGATSLTTLSAKPGWKYQTPPSRDSLPASRALHSCCDVQTRQALPPHRKGVLVKREIVCNETCKTPRTGKNCTSADCRQCS